MRGCDYKLKGIRSDILTVPVSNLWLESKLNPEMEIDPARIKRLTFSEIGKIAVSIQMKRTWFEMRRIRIVHVHMFCKTHLVKSQCDSFFDHFTHRGI